VLLVKLSSAVAVAIMVIGLAACGGGGDSDTADTSAARPDKRLLPGPRTPAGKQRPTHPRSHHGPPGTPLKATVPARIVPHPDSIFSDEVMYPVTNGWMTSTHRNTTIVDAGGDPIHHTTGLFGIFRGNNVHVTQREDLVKVPGTGPVTITRAPLGAAVEVSAQRRGILYFTSKSGITGTLDLSTDTVTLSTGAVIKPASS
jgi:hypothetical protein